MLVLFFGIGLSQVSNAEEGDATPELSDNLATRERERTSILNAAELRRWSFASKEDGATLTVSKPVMQWSHFAMGRYYGDLHIVTEKGKPVAAFAMFRWFHPTTPAYVCTTALDNAKVVAKRNGKIRWQPRGSAVDWKPLPNAGRPSGSKPIRLGQMRQYARRFSGKVSSGPVADRNAFKELRLLPQPIYQYSTDTVDGAIFAFSEGTNPAVLLCLETDLDQETIGWRYGIAQRWSWESRMSYEGEEVWTAPSTRTKDTNSKSPYRVTLIPNDD